MTDAKHTGRTRDRADATARLLDANANRCAEGLRTLEDVARFVLDDAELSAEAKSVRHALRCLVRALAGPGLIEARDTPGDVGTAISEPGERTRAGMHAIAEAAGNRACESLRVLEEASKVSSPGEAAALEALRYRVYGLQRAVCTRARAIAPQWRVCVLLTASLCAGRDPVEVLRSALRGGADCVQVREKDMDSGPLLEHTRRVVRAAREFSAGVIVNDRPDIARLAGADGVHVGQRDLPVADARRIAGEGAIVGVSTADLGQARKAVADGAGYCGCGPMFTSTTKPRDALAGPAYLRAYLDDPATASTPHLAISGIDGENIGGLAEIGCRGVAVSLAVCAADDPGAVCRRLRETLEGAPSGV
ncbi:MAG: thiamine phosphate synthase [Phycisphaerales bacterium JB040]